MPLFAQQFKLVCIVSLSVVLTMEPHASGADELALTLRYQTESSIGSGRYHPLTRQEKWQARETAIIVCDVWDLHHCLNAVRRVEEFAPRLNSVLKSARSQGVTIIHAPSDCMSAYENHPARMRSMGIPKAKVVPYDVAAWCSLIPAEERGAWPIDQSDGGEDDDPVEHAKWAKSLAAKGRNPGMPWAKQSDLIEIHDDVDFVSDRGDEIWNILESRGIRNVILTGVHTNMCVIGRPFGLRQMARTGKNVVLMRDMTDTMYNPQRWPYVSHFTGTDLIVSHIERFVCPTITSDQLIGGTPFRFAHDDRKHLVVLAAEDEYETNQTLPAFAQRYLGKHFRVTFLFGDDRERHHIPGCELIDEADVLLVSVRRRWLPAADMERIRRFVDQGKPVIGVRTASHAFSVRNKKPPEGMSDWEAFDAQVFGGNYHGHLANDLKSNVQVVPNAKHPILRGVARGAFPQGWSLYQTSPLRDGATTLLTGKAAGHPEEPVAWTFRRADGGNSFYTSLGSTADFNQPEFQRLLLNAVYWAADLEVPDQIAATPTDHWSTVSIPPHADSAQDTSTVPTWYRCTVKVPKTWIDSLQIEMQASAGQFDAWFNGAKLVATSKDARLSFTVNADDVSPDDANLLVIRAAPGKMLTVPPGVVSKAGKLVLAGRWQTRTGDDQQFANIPLPAKFGTASDIVFAPEEPLWQARPHTPIGAFTAGIEGPGCDRDGNVYAVNFAKEGTIGRITPRGEGEVFVELPEGSIGNGIRFDRRGHHFFVADYTKHNVLQVDTKTRAVSVLGHNDAMNQPNDLAIAPDGTLYASDPNWGDSTGQLWRIDRDGTVTRLVADMGTTNGIEVSPDGKQLYVNESVQRNIWVFDITEDKKLTNKRLLKQFADHGFDGMRCDVDGNLYVTRYGKGTVVKLTPQGNILKEVHVLGLRPSNLCFGGLDGRTVYVTEVEFGRLVQFRVDRPGRAFSEWRD